MTTFFEENDEPTETDQQLRDKEIKERLDRALINETVARMIERYYEYESDWLGGDR